MNVIDTDLLDESQDRYLSYALSVVSGRALPDIRDGLKPVQRRILYAMYKELNLKPTSSHKKSATIVGQVLGRYHPHGDVPCYEAMVRMSQDFSLRYPIVDGQGNFGSLDGDPPAAYRYTEAKLREIAIEILGEIDEETVDFIDNFDSSAKEPSVLPSKVPNLLINGSSGIAVGMATNIPPHNFKEVVDALLLELKNPKSSIADLSSAINGPDFPTSCEIHNSKKELREIYETGKGSVKMKATWKVEEAARGKQLIVIKSIPFGINKASLVEKIAHIVIAKKLPQVADIRDESTEDVRIVLELSAGASPESAMAYLFKNTTLSHNFNVNLTALFPEKDGFLIPKRANLKEMLACFLEFRQEVVVKRLKFEKKNLLARIHILEGFKKIFDKLDEAIKIVRKSEGRQDSALKLKKKFKLSDLQSFAIVDMRIYQLSKTHIKDLLSELKSKKDRVKEIDSILASKAKVKGIVRKELQKLSQTYGDKRKSKIVRNSKEIEFDQSDYILEEDAFAIVTKDSWIKRIRQNNDYSSTRLRQGDSILEAHPVSTTDTIVFVTSQGTLYTLSVSDFPSSSGYGDPIQKHLKFKDGEKIIRSFILEKDDQETQLSLLAKKPKLILVSKKGIGFCIEMEEITSLKKNGKRIAKLKKGDELAAVDFHNKKLAMFTKKGSGLVINSKEAPIRNQASVGVALMGVRDGDALVGICCFNSSKKINILLESGKTKEISSKDMTSGGRGLKGSKVITKGAIQGVLHD